jgi:hypothetical protein
MNKIQKICLTCKHYRLDDIHSGVCRVEKKSDGIYPMKLNGDICECWTDCGQQYYIRKGWIKAKTEVGQETV